MSNALGMLLKNFFHLIWVLAQGCVTVVGTKRVCFTNMLDSVHQFIVNILIF